MSKDIRRFYRLVIIQLVGFELYQFDIFLLLYSVLWDGVILSRNYKKFTYLFNKWCPCFVIIYGMDRKRFYFQKPFKSLLK